MTALSNRYVLGPPIASGGMGKVHIGRLRGAEDFSRLVAIKCLRAELSDDPEHVAMFLDEARMAARIRHANVVPTLDVLRSGGELWLVMEYIAGEALAKLIRAGPVPPEIALGIFHDVLAGLDGAHEATDPSGAPLGLVHRDISPQNILIGTDGVTRIADFGIAKARNREYVTRNGEFKGKLGYAAPEVVRGEPSSVQADVYSAAVTLWETLVGRRLFTAENDAALLFKVLESVPPRVSVAAPSVGTAFDEVVACGLERDPSRRFSSAREMLEALDACGKRSPARTIARWLEETVGDSLRAQAKVAREFEALGSFPDTTPAGTFSHAISGESSALPTLPLGGAPTELERTITTSTPAASPRPGEREATLRSARDRRESWSDTSTARSPSHDALPTMLSATEVHAPPQTGLNATLLMPPSPPGRRISEGSMALPATGAVAPQYAPTTLAGSAIVGDAPPPSRRKPLVAALMVGAIAVSAGAIAAFAMTRPTLTATTGSPSSEPAAPTELDPPSGDQPVTAPPPASAPSEPTPPPAESARPPTPAPPRSARANPTSPSTAPVSKKSNCSPPYTLDSHGDKHYKPECLRTK